MGDSFHMEACGSVFRKVGQMDAYAHLSIRRQVTGRMFFLYVTGMAQPFKPVRASNLPSHLLLLSALARLNALARSGFFLPGI